MLILLFASYLTRPLTKVAGTMENIIRTGDLSNRVAVEYHDEIGKLAHTFNLMVGELEKAYNEIKTLRLQGRRWPRSASTRSATSSRSTCPGR